MTEESSGGFIKRTILGIIVGFGIANSMKYYAVNKIPNCEVQQGYVAPSRLEIKCEDLDKNGKPETMMKIDDQHYLLREIDGNPVLSAYEIKSNKIQYKK